jgi:carbonic anhydrase
MWWQTSKRIFQPLGLICTFIIGDHDMKLNTVLFALLFAPLIALATDAPPPKVNRVLSVAEQAALTPDDVIVIFAQGNERFVSGNVTSRDHSAMVREAALGQHPKAIVLSCIDSRVPVEDVFDRGIGDLFVARVAGNFENTDILGSMEYATKVSGSKVILVLGHTECGAIKSAIDGVELGNITQMLANIQPAITSLADYPGDKSSKNNDYVRQVTEQNVRLTMDNIRKRSPIIAELEQAGEVKIIGAVYDMHTGVVQALD